MIWVFITVDLENMNTPLYENRYEGNLVTGEVLSPLLEIFDRHQVRATFFASVFEACLFSLESLGELLRHIESKGHDVQLHTHPIWCYGREHMWQYSLKEQIRIIRHGKALMREWLGKDPVAHRAGAYGANEDTLKALRENGIPVDSSMFFNHPNCKITWSRNRLVEQDGLVEIPVTGFMRERHLGAGALHKKIKERFVKTDIKAAAPFELTSFVRQAREQDIRLMNLFMHSYSLLDHDETFSRFRPNSTAEAALDTVLRDLSRDPDIRFITMTGFWKRYRESPAAFSGSDHVPVVVSRLGVFQAARNILHKWKIPLP